jgi:hypothetical protein
MVKSELDGLKSTSDQAFAPFEFLTGELADLRNQIKQNLEGEINTS